MRCNIYDEILILLFVLICLMYCECYNYMGCSGYPRWETDYSNQVNDTLIFQDWLYSWQHNEWRCQKYGTDSFLGGYGIGNSLLRSVIALSRSLESGKIFRPQVGYFWASNTYNCTYNISSLDCYFQGLSPCKINSIDTKTNMYTDSMNRDDLSTIFGRMLNTNNPDICIIAKTIKKSIAWVGGQYLHYILRSRKDIQDIIHHRIRNVYHGIDKHHYSTIAVQYRGGEPDYGRKVISLDIYMKLVSEKASYMASIGRPVSVVYLASQDNLNIFHNISYLNHRYPSNYTYKFLYPLIEAVNGSKEIELELRNHPEIPKLPYYLEFLSDLQLMVKSDVFIGSISTIYMIVMLLRYSKHPTRDPMMTCLIKNDEEVICENNPKKYEIYAYYKYWILGNGAGGEDPDGGFRGGTPF